MTIINSIKYVPFSVDCVTAFTTTRGALEQESKVESMSARELSCYGEFNLGMHVGDCAQQVAQNRQHLLFLLADDINIQWLDQVHGNSVACVEQYSARPITADAAITSNKNIALAIMTADCLPILLADTCGSVIAAIHGGWRPLAAGVIANTLETMNVNPSQVIAWLGPCISQPVFEVGAEVKKAFVELDPTLINAFVVKKPLSEASTHEKYYADLKKIAKSQLNMLGVCSIIEDSDCTYSLPRQYYSYRRDGQTGRMASVIAFK